MRFKQFIIEQTQLNEAKSGGNFAIKKLGEEEWVDWVEQNCSDYLPRASEYAIYRGFQNKTIDLGVKNTNEFTRQSAESAPNYYTLWMDNTPQWKDYPKRSKSFIGSSNFLVASGYGKQMQLFPANDAKIGICPASDIWYSFNNVPGKNMYDFVNLLENAFKKIYDKNTAKRANTNWTEFKQLLETTSTSEFIKVNKEHHNLLKNFNEKKYPRLIDYFEEEIVPWKHGFQHATPANYSVTSTEKKEVWVQGKVALLATNSVFDLNNRYLIPKTSVLFSLLSKYNIKNPYNFL